MDEILPLRAFVYIWYVCGLFNNDFILPSSEKSP
jgi:hypothetical protein